ncbi:hypothetical protein RJ641_024274 [Dillenia turbinata]|uniref:Lipoyl-binding domain-containing protein n=1 Tax=Dillenia turbinata TaxID=194707 RepID=A0AAN8YTA2_9MAGN
MANLRSKDVPSILDLVHSCTLVMIAWLGNGVEFGTERQYIRNNILSGSFRASNIKVSNLAYGRTQFGISQSLSGISPSARWKLLPFSGLRTSSRSYKASIVCCSPSSEIKPAATGVDDCSEEKTSALTSQFVPNSHEVQRLLADICDTTSIAEFELKLGGFQLYVKRDVAGRAIRPTPPHTLAPVSINTNTGASDINGSASSPSLAISKPMPSTDGVQTLLDKAVDEGLVIIQSPRVGFFRRSRTIKGKRAPPSCKEADVSGEVVRILREDGEPVGYGDALISILPSFPGIKKLQ